MEQTKTPNLIPAKRTTSEYTSSAAGSNSPKSFHPQRQNRPSAMRKLDMDGSRGKNLQGIHHKTANVSNKSDIAKTR